MIFYSKTRESDQHSPPDENQEKQTLNPQEEKIKERIKLLKQYIFLIN